MAETSSSSGGNEPQSWADMVRSIDKERKQLPWDPATTQPVQRVSNYVVRVASLPPVDGLLYKQD